VGSDQIKDIRLGREGHVGGTAADNRLFVEAVIFRFRADIPWRDLPERFGDWKIVYQRFNRWAKSGLSPCVTTSSQRSSSPAFTSPALPSSSTEDRPWFSVSKVRII
jgi:Putative transposase of IS4/5 family (DUF4096)